MNRGQPQGRQRRFGRYLRRTILGLLVLVLLVLLGVHIPFVQDIITNKATRYLSQKTGGTFKVDKLRFSILGNISLDGLIVLEPDSDTLVALRHFQVHTCIPGLLTNDFVLDDLLVDGTDINLVQSGDDMNIDFIIDAFNAGDTNQQTSPTHLDISSNSIVLLDVDFAFLSDAANVYVISEKLDLQQGTMSLSPNVIRADSVVLRGIAVNVITAASQTSRPAISDSAMTLPPLDFWTGFDIGVEHILIDSTQIAYSDGSPAEPEKFSTGNIEIPYLHLIADGVRTSDELLAIDLRELNGELNGIPVDSITLTATADPQSASVNDLIVRAGHSNVEASLNLQYDSWEQLPTNLGNASGKLEVEGLIAKADLDYLIPDSLASVISSWKDISLDSHIEHARSKTTVRNLDLATGKSRIVSQAELNNVISGDKLSWSAARITGDVGPEFAGSIGSFAGDIAIPPDVTLNVSSDGSIESFAMEANISSSWGSVISKGDYGYADENFSFDSDIDGQYIALDSILGLDWADSCDIEVAVIGKAGDDLGLAIDGRIITIGLFDQSIEEVLLTGTLTSDSVTADIESRDPYFPLTAHAAVGLFDTLGIHADIAVDSFAVGRLTQGDSSLYATTDLVVDAKYSSDFTTGGILFRDIGVMHDAVEYTSDSLEIDFLSSTDSSRVEIRADDLNGSWHSNFDLREIAGVFDTALSGTMLVNPRLYATDYDYTLTMELLNSAPLEILGVDNREFSSIRLRSRLDNTVDNLIVELNTGNFAANALELDTFGLALQTDSSGITLSSLTENIVYDSFRVGSLSWVADRKGDVIYNDLRLVRDSTEAFGLRAQMSSEDQELYVQVDSIILLDNAIDATSNAPVVMNDTNIYFDNFKITEGTTEVLLDGGMGQFAIDIQNLPLRNIDSIFIGNNNVVNRGSLDADIAVEARDRKFRGDVTIDSVQFYSAPPLNITFNAESQKNEVPFILTIENDSNIIDAQGRYFLNENAISADAHLAIQQLEAFEFVTRQYLEEMDGALDADVSIKGPLNKPAANGRMQLSNVNIVVREPRSEFTIVDEAIEFTERGVQLNSFTLLDVNNNPLVINGALETSDYREFNYDLNVQTDEYILIDNPKNSEYDLRGLLSLGADIDVSGSESDLKLNANININDSTDITYILPQRDVELITGAGIVQWVDPNSPEDSLRTEKRLSYYDSLIASLPTLDLSSTLRINDAARLEVLLDERSGDYLEVSGSAVVDLKMDRTGNIQMNGNYVIQDGKYQLSFYDLVQKKFDIAEGSRIQWSGSPDEGSIDITAKHTVRTSSIGLVGNEVSENESYLYRRSLPYTISIYIKGTIEEPDVSFGLDLPQDDRLSYPVLDNKLSRLEQPEFETERNKQVFGLLVLGGFIPEAADDFDEMAVATTAIANSVNGLLAAQLNRLTNKIKGVDINIGLQSYSDFQSGAGVRTAVDFRVTKRLANDRLSIEVGGEMDVSTGQASAYQRDGFRGDVTVVYDLTESGNTKLKAFNNETYDIVYHEIRNTGIALIFVREFDKGEGVLPRKDEKKR